MQSGHWNHNNDVIWDMNDSLAKRIKAFYVWDIEKEKNYLDIHKHKINDPQFFL